jgi:hypothetical protein
MARKISEVDICILPGNSGGEFGYKVCSHFEEERDLEILALSRMVTEGNKVSFPVWAQVRSRDGRTLYESKALARFESAEKSSTYCHYSIRQKLAEILGEHICGRIDLMRNPELIC